MAKNEINSGVTRREFLKIGGAAAAGSAIAMGTAQADVKTKSAGTSPKIEGEKVLSVCQYCAVGCGLVYYVKDGKVVHVEGDPENPINNGSLCSKGTAHIQLINNDLRIKKPMKRTGNGGWQEITWGEAITTIADELAKVKENHGPDALAFMGSAAVLNEEVYSFQKLVRLLGTNNIEHQARECHASTVAALVNSFGFGAMTNHWTDMQNTKCAFIIGSNTVECHPIAMQHIMEARDKNGAKIICADPRLTKSAAKADLFMQHRPGTDIALIGAIIKYVIDNKKYDEKFLMERTVAPFIVDRAKHAAGDYANAFVLETETVQDTEMIEEQELDEAGNPVLDDEGNPVMVEKEIPKTDAEGNPVYKEVQVKGKYKKADGLEGHPDTAFNILKETVAPYTFEEAEKITWVPAAKIEEAAKMFSDESQGTRVVNGTEIKNCATIIYSMGSTQHTVGVQYIRNYATLQLLLGNAGRPGGGINALRGHNNVQGSTDMCALAHIWPGYINVRGKGQDWKSFFGSCSGSWTGEGPEPDYDEFVKDITTPVSDPMKGKWMQYNSWCSRKRGMLAILNYWCIREDQMAQGVGLSVVPMFRAMKDGSVKAFWALGENPMVANPNLNDTKAGLKNLDVLIVSDLFEPETAAVERKEGSITILLPACTFSEKTGSQTNSPRVVQWCYQAIDPMYECKSDLEVVLRVARKLSDKGALLHDENIKGSSWDKAWNRYGFDPSTDPDTNTLTGAELESAAIEVYKEMDLCNRLYRGQYDWNTGEVLAKRRGTDPGGLGTTYPDWGWCWPVNQRILYHNENWDGQGGPGGSNFDFITTEKKGLIYAPRVVDGPIPTHKEPAETPMPELNSKYPRYRGVQDLIDTGYNVVGDKSKYPIVLTTHRLLEHHLAGQKTRNLPWLCELEPEPYCAMSKTLADKLGVKNGDKVKVTSARHPAGIIIPARVDGRMDGWDNPQKQVVSIPWHWGDKGLCTGPSANLLTVDARDPNANIPEYKACLCNVEKA